MTEIKYNSIQINELKSNKYVKNATAKHIVFNKEFKIKALELSHKYMLPKEIFKKWWFPEYVVDSDIPKNSISRWKRNIKQRWEIEEKKWKHKKVKIDFNNMTKDQELEYLRAKLAYYEEISEYIKSWLP